MVPRRRYLRNLLYRKKKITVKRKLTPQDSIGNIDWSKCRCECKLMCLLPGVAEQNENAG